MKPQSVKPEVIYYTDGLKILQNGINYKWAVVKMYRGKTTSFSVFCVGSAQIAELTAIVQAFSDAEKCKLSKIKIITDSIHVHDGIAKNLPDWDSRNF